MPNIFEMSAEQLRAYQRQVEMYQHMQRTEVGWITNSVSPIFWYDDVKALNKKRQLDVYRKDSTTRVGDKELDKWYFYDRTSKLIREMTCKELDEHISRIEKGWFCYGQQPKIVTLKRIREELYGSNMKLLKVDKK